MKLRMGIVLYSCILLLSNNIWAQSIKSNLSISISRGNPELPSSKATGIGFLQFKNYNLFEVYRSLLMDQQISLEKPSEVILKRDYVNVSLKSDSLLFEDGKIILMDSLLKQYHQKLQLKNKIEKRWALSLEDSKKLETFVTKNLMPGMVQSKSFNGSELSVINMSISEIISAVEDLIQVPIVNSIYEQHDQKYNMSIVLNPVSGLTQQFRSKGLRYTLQPVEIRTAVIE